MSITEQGIAGEKQARQFILDRIKPDTLQQADWIYKKDGKYYVVEVKNKEMFKAPPFDGTGLDIKQIERRKSLCNDLNMRCLLIVYEPNGNDVYYQWLDKLEQGEHFDTRNGARIYPIQNFKRIDC